MQTSTHMNREFHFSDADFKFIASLANGKTGIVLGEQKRDMVYSRLARRVRALGLEDFAAYCALLQSPEGHDELPHLVNAITTNLTGFFREPHHFEHLKQMVVAPMAAQKGPKQLRLWSAACSSGMEAYSMAMVVRSMASGADWDARILATDIDSNMIQHGSRGAYSAADVKTVPAAYQDWIKKGDNDSVEMDSSLRALIAFNQLNLLESWPMRRPFDAVFCRNVIIYFDKPTKQKLFERMAQVIKPGGWLYIGHSENLHGISDRFELVGRTIYRRLP